MTGVARALGESVGHVDRVRRDHALAPLTTFRVGGRAEWFLELTRDDELAPVVAAADRLGIPVTMLGGGSNVLVSDAGVRGLVIRMRHGAIAMPAAGIVRASAGITLNGLIRWTIRRGWAGLEMWAGTPGTVGGAIYGNAHFQGRLIDEVVSAVHLVDRHGAAACVAASEMDFGYDRSRLQMSGEAVASVAFRVTEANPAVLRNVARESLAFRKRTQPLAEPSAGCAFQNPVDQTDRLPPGMACSAGALIDAAGLKGHRVGGASVSALHGNFVVTTPGATAADVHALITHCRREVSSRYDVTLVPEIRLLGEFTVSSR